MAAVRRRTADRSPRPARAPTGTSGKARRHGPTRAGRPSQEGPGDGGLRRLLIDVALDLVEVSGTRGLSWREIARRANVSHTAPYRHFANKEGLLAAVAEEGFRSLTARMTAEMDRAPDDVSRRLEAMAVAYVEFAAENPAHFRVMFGRDVPDFSKHAGLREAHDLTDGLFRAGVAAVLKEAGRVGVEIDVDHFALMAWSLVHGLASLTVDGRVGDVGEVGGDPGERMRSLTRLIKKLVDGTGA